MAGSMLRNDMGAFTVMTETELEMETVGQCIMEDNSSQKIIT